MSITLETDGMPDRSDSRRDSHPRLSTRAPARLGFEVANLLVILLLIILHTSPIVAFDKKKPTPAALRWSENRPGCTFSRDTDGKYRYSLWTDDYGVILAVDSQELQMTHKRVQRFFGVQLTVRYRGQGTLVVDPGQASLEFVKHFKLVQSSLDPEDLANKTQNDADELEHQMQREIEKHPERKQEREKYLQEYQKEAAQLIEFISQRAFPAVQLQPGHDQADGWLFFSVKNKWLGEWKRPEEFLLRIPVNDRVLEFPFTLPPKQGDLILRQRPN
jgi:hypothetical protein